MKRSPVWDHFEKIDDKKVKCKLCLAVLAFHGGTTSMQSHLLSRHPDEYRAPEAKNRTMDDFVVSKKCSTARASEITRRIAEMAARDLRPLSIVEGSGFKSLMSYVEPGYVVPSRTHIAAVCRRLYNTQREKLQETVSSCESVALTTDIWTSAAVHGYMTLTVHFIGESWSLYSKVLLTDEMPERHTGQNIADRLKKAAGDWSIPTEHIIACVHDNAANAVNGLQLTGWPHFGCVAHTLQLCINSGLDAPAITRMTATARKIVGHFKHSVVAMSGLREKQVQLDVPQHHLIQDVATRWNSTFFMLDRLAEQRVAIYAVIHDHAITKPQHRHLDLKDDQWELLSQLVTVLKPLQMATTVFSSDINVSCSIVYPVINGLLTNHLVVAEDDVSAVATFKKVVAEELKRRFVYSPDSIPILSAAVDPRYSNLLFLDSEKRDAVHEELIGMMDAEEHGQDSEDTDSQEPPTKKPKDSAMHFLLGTSSEQQVLSSHDELQQFVKEPTLHLDSSALEWWKKNHERYPKVAKIAKRLLCVPATSVPAERVFSTSGIIVNKLRSSLTPENVNMLVFLNKNLPPVSASE